MLISRRVALRRQRDVICRLRRGSLLLGALACAILLAVPGSAAASGPRELEQPYVETAGRAEVGETLSCYPGAWEGSGVTYTYEWQRDSTALASGQTHQITAADEGHWLSCVVTATDSEGTTTAPSVDSFFINPPIEGPPKGGTIEGNVTDAVSGQPVAGVKACAVNTDEAEPWDCVHTDASGRYAMTVAEADQFIVRFTVPSDSPYITNTFYGEAYSRSEASVLTIASGSTTTGVDVQLHEGGRITGVATDALTGLAVEGVEVCAREAPAPCVQTNALGEYTISQLASGSYVVEFGFGYGGGLGETYVAPEYYDGLVFPRGSDLSEATQVSVTAGETVSEIDATMHHWGSLTGQVTSASTNAPIEGVEVDAYDGSQHTAVTDANGEYTISHLGNRTGEYTVSFAPRSGEALDFFPQWYNDKESQLESDPVHVSLDQTTSGIDAALEEGGQITGRVTDGSTQQPLAEITVCAWSKIVWESRCAWTNPSGEYAIQGLPTDEYQVSFYTNADNYYSQTYSSLVAVAIGKTTAGIDAAMEPVVKGTIMGSVSEAVWAKALANIDVCAYDIEQEEPLGECTKTSSTGAYELRGLSAGKYIVEFSSPGPGLEYASQFYDDRVSVLNAEEVVVQEGKFTAGIHAALEKAGDASGSVVSAETGSPLSGIEVCYYARNEELADCVVTDGNGQYTTPPVAVGEYKVLFISPFESGLNYAAQFYGGVASVNDSPAVVIEAGKLTTGIDAQMRTGGRITGTVTNAGDGAGLEGALVCALSGYGEVGGCALTHSGGEYAIEGLASGTYDVLFEAEGYRWQLYNDVRFLSEAQAITVSAGTTSDGIDAAMQPTNGEAPRDLRPPAISGDAAVGDVLECSSGSWAGSPTPTETYTWLRTGRTYVGSGSAYRVQRADEGSSLACEVVAENSVGSASALSDPVNIPAATEAGVPPPPPPSQPVVPVVREVIPPASISAPSTTTTPLTPAPDTSPAQETRTSASISGGRAVRIYAGRRGGIIVDSGEIVRCPAGALSCQVAVEVRTKRRNRRVQLASVRLDVPGGEVQWLKFKLDAAGTALLRKLRRIDATVDVAARLRGARPVTATRMIVLRKGLAMELTGSDIAPRALVLRPATKRRGTAHKKHKK